MTALATLIAIAAWCGYPTTNLGEISGITPHQVNECRQEIKACLDKTPRNMACFTEQEVGK